ncbi:glycosyltransferase family 4 protein [Streptomyces sp. ALI-76-A]|uniref:glycosyltransferase family 4 protein n=1 Tax=Streptomyces sp. ALI-76-A TaxID=3025736 RepID=UPI00256EC6E7|nr:glycosyltransferase family 4 protein [Streptomyces sp. ALI-76-A]MDL5199787.1 glycosyltransferase family 4 protein [Streptomyces sp. ALI-76-A]
MALQIMHVLSRDAPGELSGVDTHVLELMVCQEAAGHRPSVIACRNSEFFVRARARGLVVHPHGAPDPYGAARTLMRAADYNRPNVVHAHGGLASVAASVACMLSSQLRTEALVFTHHGTSEDTWVGRLRVRAESLAARRADGLIACADGLVPRMRHWNKRARLGYIPNGVEVPDLPERPLARQALRQRFGVPSSPPLLCYVGRLAPEKAPSRVLRVAAVLGSRQIPVHTLFVGCGPQLGSLREEAARRGLSGRVTFTGLVRDMGTVYAAADALVLLSRTEATPRVVLEAMSCGVPVVASAVGGVPDLLGYGKYGTLTAGDDEESAVAGVLRALRLRGSEQTVLARRHAHSEYGVERMSSRIEDFYLTALA